MDDRSGPLSTAARTSTVDSRTGHLWRAQPAGDGIVVTLAGDWTVTGGVGVEPGSVQSIVDAARQSPRPRIAFDSRKLGRWDSSLLVFLADLRRTAADSRIALDPAGLPEAAARLLALSAEAIPMSPRGRSANTLLSRTGQSVINAGTEAGSVMTLVGECILSSGRVFRGGIRMRGVDLLNCVYDAGVAALMIVTIVNVLVGGILAFVGAVQLQRFGAGIFVADLIGIAMTREMVPLMTAIVMSGRTGGAYAAHIATMVGNEEIDALRVIGIPINDYLILPRLLALTGMMPLLYLYGCAVGIFGGFAVSVAMLNLSPAGFIDEMRDAVTSDQVVFGLVKSTAFGALIAIVGCRAGLRAGRSAADVGQAATTAVVVGIVGVIALDAVFAVCANALHF